MRRARVSWDTGFSAPNGVSVWGTPTIDVANNAILIGTGQNLSQAATSNSDSIISLDMTTGKVKWVFQSTAGDAWNASCQAPAAFDGHCSKPEGKDHCRRQERCGLVPQPPDRRDELVAAPGRGRQLGGHPLGYGHRRQARLCCCDRPVWVNKIQKLALADRLAIREAVGANMAQVEGGKRGQRRVVRRQPQRHC